MTVHVAQMSVVDFLSLEKKEKKRKNHFGGRVIAG